MKLNKQIPSFTMFLNYKKEQMKMKPLLPFQEIWNPLELDQVLF